MSKRIRNMLREIEGFIDEAKYNLKDKWETRNDCPECGGGLVRILILSQKPIKTPAFFEPIACATTNSLNCSLICKCRYLFFKLQSGRD